MAKKLLGAMTNEGRPQAFYWQYGWADGGFLTKNNVSLTRASLSSSSPTRRRLTTNGEQGNVESARAVPKSASD